MDRSGSPDRGEPSDSLPTQAGPPSGEDTADAGTESGIQANGLAASDAHTNGDAAPDVDVTRSGSASKHSSGSPNPGESADSQPGDRRLPVRDEAEAKAGPGIPGNGSAASDA